MKVFKNTQENFTKMYKDGQFLKIIVPHSNQYNNVYKETETEHGLKNIDILYAVQYKGHIIGCPKDLSSIKIDLIHTLADEYAINNFQYRESNYNGVKVYYITSSQIYLGASIISAKPVCDKISQLYMNRDFSFMFIDENQIICFPDRLPGETKEKSEEIIRQYQNIIKTKFSYELSKYVYKYERKTENIVLQE